MSTTCSASQRSSKKTPTRKEASSSKKPVPNTLSWYLHSKFVLYDLFGKERGYYEVKREDICTPDVLTTSPSHHIIIVDRSGSMYGTIEDLKSTLLKLLVLDEYAQSDMKVSLISYSDQGDCTLHFQNRPIQDVMKRDSFEQRQIKQIRVTGMTCISQALKLATSLCTDKELTAITLHSDGYANDPSSYSEVQELERLCGYLGTRKVFLNTIAHSDYSDFRLLAKLANMVSGSCIKVRTLQEVYDALYATEKVLGAPTTPAIEILPEKEWDPSTCYQVFFSRKGNKINGSDGHLSIKGLRASDDRTLYRFRKIPRAAYRKLKVPVAQTSEAVIAFARAQLAEGNLNTAKYAMASSFSSTLVRAHSRALTNLQIADMAQDLDALLFDPEILKFHKVENKVPVNKKMSVITLIRLLEDNKKEFSINLDHLRSNYTRRGLKRVDGTRDEKGKLIEPTLRIEVTDPSPLAHVSSFDVNRNTANLNMLISRPVQLVTRKGNHPITSVAGVDLSHLKTFNNYTLIGDGELNVKTLKVRLTSKLFKTLNTAGVLEDVSGNPPKKFSESSDYYLRLDDLPLVPRFQADSNLDGTFKTLAGMKVLISLISAHLKEESDSYSPSQVDELKKHYLSKNLYINFPTTYEYLNKYSDLKEALAAGAVDSRVSYKIDIGDRDILNMGKLMSANKFLDRMYEVFDKHGQKIDKPTCETLLDDDVSVQHKVLSSRLKFSKVDEFMKKIFDQFLGLDDGEDLFEILKEVNAKALITCLRSKRKGKKVLRPSYMVALTEAKGLLEDSYEEIYQEEISPIVFYIGSTGVLPDEMSTKSMTAEALSAKYPDLSLSKDEKEGMFFDIGGKGDYGNTILSVVAKNEYFSR